MSILATETVSTTAGREGKSVSADGKINLQLSPPGSKGPGTNPEQLFAAGYSACFGGAIAAAAGLSKVALRGVTLPHRIFAPTVQSSQSLGQRPRFTTRQGQSPNGAR